MKCQIVTTTATIQWSRVTSRCMPETPGDYLVAFSDGTVETFPIDQVNINEGSIAVSRSTYGQWWAEHPGHPQPGDDDE